MRARKHRQAPEKRPAGEVAGLRPLFRKPCRGIALLRRGHGRILDASWKQKFAVCALIYNIDIIRIDFYNNVVFTSAYKLNDIIHKSTQTAIS